MDKERSDLFNLLEQRTQELEKSKMRFDSIIARSADGIIIVDREGIVRFINPATENLLGRKSEELLGQMFGFPISAGQTTEIDIIHKNVGKIVAEMRVVETEWEGKTAYLATLRDITERK